MFETEGKNTKSTGKTKLLIEGSAHWGAFSPDQNVNCIHPWWPGFLCYGEVLAVQEEMKRLAHHRTTTTTKNIQIHVYLIMVIIISTMQRCFESCPLTQRQAFNEQTTGLLGESKPPAPTCNFPTNPLNIQSIATWCHTKFHWSHIRSYHKNKKQAEPTKPGS